MDAKQKANYASKLLINISKYKLSASEKEAGNLVENHSNVGGSEYYVLARKILVPLLIKKEKNQFTLTTKWQLTI